MEFTTRLWAALQNNPTPGGPAPASPRARMGLTPAPDERQPRSRGLRRRGSAGTRTSSRHTSLAPAGARGFGAGLFPLRSPLLGESWLVSFPPLSDMLKFSGWSRPIRGRDWWRGWALCRETREGCRRRPHPGRGGGHTGGGPERSGGLWVFRRTENGTNPAPRGPRERVPAPARAGRPPGAAPGGCGGGHGDAEPFPRRLILHYRAQPVGAAGTRRSRGGIRRGAGIPSIGMNDRPSDGRGSGREGPGRHVRSKCR